MEKQPFCYTPQWKECHSFGGFNVIRVISFWKESWLEDPVPFLLLKVKHQYLASNQIHRVSEIIKLESTLKEYNAAAIQIEKKKG